MDNNYGNKHKWKYKWTIKYEKCHIQGNKNHQKPNTSMQHCHASRVFSPCEARRVPCAVWALDLWAQALEQDLPGQTCFWWLKSSYHFTSQRYFKGISTPLKSRFLVEHRHPMNGSTNMILPWAAGLCLGWAQWCSSKRKLEMML